MQILREIQEKEMYRLKINDFVHIQHKNYFIYILLFSVVIYFLITSVRMSMTIDIYYLHVLKSIDSFFK